MLSALKGHEKPLFLLAVLTAFLYSFNLGAPGLLDPDEPFYALTAKEMLEAGNWLVPKIFGQPQFEKPIFFYWMELLSFRLFGFEEWAARLAPCLAGFAAVFVTYAWAQALFRNKRISFASALILATAAEYVVCSRIVLTDMVFCLFVASAWLFFTQKREHWAFFFAGLGVLTKGPLGLMIPLMSVATKKGNLRFKGFWVFLAVAVPWYAYMAWQYGPDYLYQFFIHENVRRFFVAEHKGMDRFYFYPGALLGGFFPWTVFLPAALVYAFRQAVRNRTCAQKRFLFLSLSFWLPFIFFSVSKSKLLSYVFPLFPVLAVLAGAWVVRFERALKMGFRAKPVLWFWAILAWAVFPAALAAAAYSYKTGKGLELTAPISAIAAVIVPACIAALVFFALRRLKAMAACLVAMTFGFTVLAFSWLLPSADILFSSEKWVRKYEREWAGTKDPHFLASKLYVRGVSFYSGEKGMAVVAESPARAFYTRHDIPIYSKKEEFLEIPKNKYPLYGFLRQKELKFMRRILDDPRFRIEMMEEDAVRVLIRLHRMDSRA